MVSSRHVARVEGRSSHLLAILLRLSWGRGLGHWSSKIFWVSERVITLAWFGVAISILLLLCLTSSGHRCPCFFIQRFSWFELGSSLQVTVYLFFNRLVPIIFDWGFLLVSSRSIGLLFWPWWLSRRVRPRRTTLYFNQLSEWRGERPFFEC